MRAALLLTLALLPGATPASDEAPKRLLVLGIDGMDPVLLQRYMDQGRMPNFQAFAQRGSFRPLGTANPPQSPVAWSNVITGQNPGGHAVFDFLHPNRDPDHGPAYMPVFSTAAADPVGMTMPIPGTDWEIPLSGGEMRLLRDGKSFWEHLEDEDIPAQVWRIPANFPPVECDSLTFSGMGTPDLQGGYGTYSFYTSNPLAVRKVDSGEVLLAAAEDGVIRTHLTGPDQMRKSGKGRKSRAPLTIHLDLEREAALLDLDGQTAILQPGKWTEWLGVDFTLLEMTGLDMLATVPGIVRFYCRSLEPFEMYASPVNMDPRSPVQPMATPDDATENLAERIGLFYTQGMAEETKGYQAGVLTVEEFLSQTKLVDEESRVMLDVALSDWDEGLLFFYLSTIDLPCHMLWNVTDTEHPGYDAERHARVGDPIAASYEEADRHLGRVIEAIGPDTPLMIISDHGFAPFHRKFNPNRWLVDHGYMTLEPGKDIGREAFLDVDWTNTVAYAIGFQSIYLNLRGREIDGVVRPEQAADLLTEIAGGLEAVVDSGTGKRAIRRAARATDIYVGAHVAEAPDLLLGYESGFAGSDMGALGAAPEALFEDNMSAWSGNHLMDPSVVPGVLLTNLPAMHEAPSLVDIAPTILDFFGLPPSPEMVGRSILN